MYIFFSFIFYLFIHYSFFFQELRVDIGVSVVGLLVRESNN